MQALEAYIRAGAGDTEKVIAEARPAHQTIRRGNRKTEDGDAGARVEEQQPSSSVCNEKKLDVQKVLEFFGQEAVARVVRESPKLHEPAEGRTKETTWDVISRLGNLWKGFLSLWISDIEKEHPEIAYENAINSMIEKYAKLEERHGGDHPPPRGPRRALQEGERRAGADRGGAERRGGDQPGRSRGRPDPEEEPAHRRHRRDEGRARDGAAAMPTRPRRRSSACRREIRKLQGRARHDAGQDAVGAGAHQDPGAARRPLGRRRGAARSTTSAAHQEHHRRGQPRQGAVRVVARLAPGRAAQRRSATFRPSSSSPSIKARKAAQQQQAPEDDVVDAAA